MEKKKRKTNAKRNKDTAVAWVIVLFIQRRLPFDTRSLLDVFTCPS